MTTTPEPHDPYVSSLANLRAALRGQPEPARAAANASETVVAVTEPETVDPESTDAPPVDPVKVPAVAKKRAPARKAAVKKAAAVKK